VNKPVRVDVGFYIKYKNIKPMPAHILASLLLSLDSILMRTLPIIEKLIPGLSLTSPACFVKSIALDEPIRLTIEFDAISTIDLDKISELDEVNGVYDNLEDALSNSDSALRMALSIAFSGIVGKSTYKIISNFGLVLDHVDQHIKNVLNCGGLIHFPQDIIKCALDILEPDESMMADVMSIISPARLHPKGSIELHILPLVKIGFTHEMISSIPLASAAKLNPSLTSQDNTYGH
jgi:hypothetical protein